MKLGMALGSSFFIILVNPLLKANSRPNLVPPFISYSPPNPTMSDSRTKANSYVDFGISTSGSILDDILSDFLVLILKAVPSPMCPKYLTPFMGLVRILIDNGTSTYFR